MVYMYDGQTHTLIAVTIHSPSFGWPVTSLAFCAAFFSMLSNTLVRMSFTFVWLLVPGTDSMLSCNSVTKRAISSLIPPPTNGRFPMLLM